VLLNNYSVIPDQVNEYLITAETEPIRQKTKLSALLLRPQVSLIRMIEEVPLIKIKLMEASLLDFEIIEQSEITLKYEGYIQKEYEIAERVNKLEDLYLKKTSTMQAYLLYPLKQGKSLPG